MPNMIRRFVLPENLLAEIDSTFSNRSAGLRASIVNASQNIGLLGDALKWRIDSRLGSDIDQTRLTVNGREPTKAVTVSWDETSDQLIDHMTAVSQLPQEQVVRLAAEGYIALLRSKSLKENKHEPARSLLTPGKGRSKHGGGG